MLLFDGRVDTCDRISTERGFVIIPPYDHPDVMAGQVRKEKCTNDDEVLSELDDVMMTSFQMLKVYYSLVSDDP